MLSIRTRESNIVVDASHAYDNSNKLIKFFAQRLTISGDML
ncbi:hypothetical protein D5b_00207 [Faustovirus]|nr:hypothetical protein D5b_00207 [Faustovirus]